MRKRVLWASLTMFGGIIGAGIFGVPFVFSRAGVLLGVGYIILLGATAALTNVYYAIVAAETPGRHRLVGYARQHLKGGWVPAVAVINLIEFFGALLAYVILGGSFFSSIFSGPAAAWSFAFLVIGALILLLPLKNSERVDHWLTAMLIVAVAAIAFLVWPQIRHVNLVFIDPKNWFVPYGVIFFALGGSSVIPEIVEVLRKDERAAIRSAALGTLAAAALIGIFGAIVVGVCGAGTTENAITGLAPYFGRTIVVLGSLFGLAAITTQFVIVGSNVRDQFVYDLKEKRLVSWALTVLVPLLAFVLGARDFVNLIGFLGATLGAAIGIVIIYMGWKVMGKNSKYAVLRRLAVPLMMLFIAGLLAEIISLFL